MVIAYKDITIKGDWTRKDETEIAGTATYVITFEIEGPKRRCLTDVNPIYADIMARDGTNVSEVCGASTVEAVDIHIEKVILPYLDPRDRLSRLHVIEDGMFSAEP